MITTREFFKIARRVKWTIKKGGGNPHGSVRTKYTRNRGSNFCPLAYVTHKFGNQRWSVMGENDPILSYLPSLEFARKVIEAADTSTGRSWLKRRLRIET